MSPLRAPSNWMPRSYLWPPPLLHLFLCGQDWGRAEYKCTDHFLMLLFLLKFTFTGISHWRATPNIKQYISIGHWRLTRVCSSLSQWPFGVCLLIDPKIKSTVRKHLQTTTGGEQGPRERSPLGGGRPRPEPAVHKSHHGRPLAATNGRLPPEHEPLLCEHERLQAEPPPVKSGAPKFEAYMMTGEHILNISRMPQNTSIVPKQQKKVRTIIWPESGCFCGLRSIFGNVATSKLRQLGNGHFYLIPQRFDSRGAESFAKIALKIFVFARKLQKWTLLPTTSPVKKLASFKSQQLVICNFHHVLKTLESMDAKSCIKIGRNLNFCGHMDLALKIC